MQPTTTRAGLREGGGYAVVKEPGHNMRGGGEPRAGLGPVVRSGWKPTNVHQDTQ